MKGVDVPLTRLYDFIEKVQANAPIVDIEGGERDVFAPHYLTGIDKSFLEIHTRKTKRTGIEIRFDAMSAARFFYDQKVSRGGSVQSRKVPKSQLKSVKNG